jgi:hypothetical protein
VLRRLVYLGIKELSNIAEDVIIVTSSLTKAGLEKTRVKKKKQPSGVFLFFFVFFVFFVFFAQKRGF